MGKDAFGGDDGKKDGDRKVLDFSSKKPISEEEALGRQAQRAPRRESAIAPRPRAELRIAARDEGEAARGCKNLARLLGLLQELRPIGQEGDTIKNLKNNLAGKNLQKLFGAIGDNENIWKADPLWYHAIAQTIIDEIAARRAANQHVDIPDDATSAIIKYTTNVIM